MDRYVPPKVGSVDGEQRTSLGERVKKRQAIYNKVSAFLSCNGAPSPAPGHL
jgi:hypothetical protein